MWTKSPIQGQATCVAIITIINSVKNEKYKIVRRPRNSLFRRHAESIINVIFLQICCFVYSPDKYHIGSPKVSNRTIISLRPMGLGWPGTAVLLAAGRIGRHDDDDDGDGVRWRGRRKLPSIWRQFIALRVSRSVHRIVGGPTYHAAGARSRRFKFRQTNVKPCSLFPHNIDITYSLQTAQAVKFRMLSSPPLRNKMQN